MIRYFDNAAASRPDPEVLDFYLQAMHEDFANQEAVHLLAYQARRDLAAAEKELCEAFFADPEAYNVAWAGSATECFRIVGAFLAGCKTVSSNSEHPALTANFKRSTNLQMLPVGSDGSIILPPEPVNADAVVFHHVQSETGAIQDLNRLFAAFPDALRMTDAVQSAGKLPLSPAAHLQIISGVKFGSPGGAAILWKKSVEKLQKFPVFVSAMRSQEYALSRINVPLCRTLAFAAGRRKLCQQAEFEHVSRLNSRLRALLAEEHIRPLLPENAAVSPYIANFFLPGIQAAVVVRALGESSVFCASGSACAAEAGGPSPALLALGKSRKDAFSGLRISFDGTVTENDVDFLAFELKKVLKNY